MCRNAIVSSWMGMLCMGPARSPLLASFLLCHSCITFLCAGSRCHRYVAFNPKLAYDILNGLAIGERVKALTHPSLFWSFSPSSRGFFRYSSIEDQAPRIHQHNNLLPCALFFCAPINTLVNGALENIKYIGLFCIGRSVGHVKWI